MQQHLAQGGEVVKIDPPAHTIFIQDLCIEVTGVIVGATGPELCAIS